ncbi:hypothetical protein C0992_000965 [Termitomyces sp. T32_za158]|nr:hypothetical protein C0992_000965 [Termitomyces sp. T32_za158]
MSIYPDNWVMIDTFLRGIPDAMRESLICDDGLLPEVNTVEKFVAHALRYKQAHKITKHFELQCSKTQVVTKAEPQKEDKPQAYICAVQTAIPDDNGVDSGNEPDVEDDEVNNLLGNVPEDSAASEAGEHLGDKFVKVDVYNDNYYAQESDTEFMGVLTDYPASELDQSIGAGNVKVYKVHLCKAPGKLARQVV